MSVNAYYKHAELALIAYANLDKGAPSVEAMAGTGVENARARQIEQQWLVIDQISSLTGLSATVFEEISTGKRYLAIRGTDGPLDVVTDIVNIARIGVPILHPQYLVLRLKIKEWMESNVLPSRFTVTGHSLGGFLAIGVASEFQQQVEHVYLYNAPGVESPLGGVFYPLARLFGALTPVDASRVTNLKADAGVSLVAGLGRQVSPTTWITIENQLLSDVPNSPAAKNHSQRVLTDSLAVYEAYQSLDGSAETSTIGQILKAASNRNALTLESGVFLLGKIFGQMFSPGIEYRDELYSALFSLRTTVTQGGYADSFKLRLLGDAGEMHLRASQPGPEGLAYRYALKELNPFALLGTASVYADHNSGGRLDLYDSAQGTGSLTDQWLRDRAQFLIWKNEKYEKDIADNVPLLRKDFGAESLLFTDLTTSMVTGTTLSIRVTGGNVLQQTDPRRISFGSEQSDILTGGRYADHLYGEGGADVLMGGEGNDYLEGGRGHDTYHYNSTNDLGGRDRIFDVDGLGVIIFDGQALTGGSRSSGNRYVSADGQFWYSFIGARNGRGSLIINDVIEVRHFRDGDLGISLQAAETIADLPYQYHYLGGDYPINGPEDDPLFRLGSDFNDEYQAGRNDDEAGFIAGLDPGFFFGKSGNDRFLGSYIWEGDFAYGGAGDDFLDGGALGQDLPPVPDTDPGNGDFLYGDAGRDVILGGQFNDRLFGDLDHPFARFVDGSNPSGPVFSLGSSGIRVDPNTHQYQVVRTPDSENGSDSWMFAGLKEAFYFALGMADDAELSTLYDDVIDGREGDDYIMGGPGSDYLIGGEGDDEILGDFDHFYYREIISPGDPDRGFGPYAYLLGLPGDDILDGGEGDDRLVDAYGGSDALYGGPGNDTLIDLDPRLSDLLYKSGASPVQNLSFNLLDGGEGDDDITSANPFGYSEIYGGDGDDTITFWSERAFGPDEHDEIPLGSPGGRGYIDGGSGDDQINIESGYAEVKGGAGSDVISVAADYLLVDQSDGEVGDYDELSLIGWSAADVLLSRADDDLILSNQHTLSVAVFLRWFEGGENQVDAIYLDDAIWHPVDIGARLASPPGPTTGDDQLYARAAGVLAAGDGNDRLTGRADRVLLDGGAGDDQLLLWPGQNGFLVGGAGGDVITVGGLHSVVAFNRGDGADTVVLPGGTISLGGIDPDDIVISESDEGLLLDFGDGDSLTLTGFDTAPLMLQIISAGQIELFDLRDLAAAPQVLSGAAMGGWLAYRHALDGSYAALPDDIIAGILQDADFGLQAQSLPASTPYAPLLLNDIPDQQAMVGSDFSLVLPEDTFLDLDSDVPLVMALSRQDGTALPAWLNFSAETRQLQGLPGAGDAGDLALRLTATDADGLSTSELFSISIAAGEVEVDPQVPDPDPAPDPNPAPDPIEPALSPDVQAGAQPDAQPELQPDSQTVIAPVLADSSGTVTDDPHAEQPTAVVTQSSTAIATDSPADDEPVRSLPVDPSRAVADSPANALRVLSTGSLIGQSAEETASDRRVAPPSRAAAEAALEQDADGDDAEFLTAQAVREASPVALPNPAESISHGLSSWEITNALLQFHLERNAVAAAENALGIGYATIKGMPGVGMTLQPLMTGMQGLGSGQLQTFAGLQDGMRSLGEVGIS